MKDLLNGGHIPTWAKMIGIGIALGLQGAIFWQTQRASQEAQIAELRQSNMAMRAEFRYAAAMDSARSAAVEAHVVAIERNLNRLTRNSNVIHKDMWDVIGTPRRHRDLED